MTLTIAPLLSSISANAPRQARHQRCGPRRELEADEDEAHWDERLRKLTKHKPKPEKPK